MGLGETLPAEWRTFQDPHSGATVRQLTRWRAHSHHLYFTNSGLWDSGRRLLVGSHRNNRENLYSVDLSDGRLTQLTDFGPEESPGLQTTFVNPVRDEAYLVNGDELLALDLRTLKTRRLYRAAPERRLGMFSCTADGESVCLAVLEDLSDRIRMDLVHGYVGFAEYCAARPQCAILAVPTAGGRPRTVYEEKFWLNHLNTSPVLPGVLTFCHEGPWERIDQRMWVLDLSSGRPQPLRRQSPGETIGHEYWFSDGQRVGYHGTREGVHRFGLIRHDNTGGREWDFPHGSSHFHSLDETLIVGDGYRERPDLLLWRLAGDRYEGPRVLARHRGSFHVQALHVHPRMFTREGRTCVAYTADPQGYGNVYVVEVPEFGSLPEAKQAN